MIFPVYSTTVDKWRDNVLSDRGSLETFQIYSSDEDKQQTRMFLSEPVLDSLMVFPLYSKSVDK